MPSVRGQPPFMDTAAAPKWNLGEEAAGSKAMQRCESVDSVQNLKEIGKSTLGEAPHENYDVDSGFAQSLWHTAKTILPVHIEQR